MSLIAFLLSTVLLSVSRSNTATLDPCPPKSHNAVYAPLPAPLPGDGDPEICWEPYLAAVATAQANRQACLNAISPTSPNVCALRAICDAIYIAWMEGAEEGYIKCVTEQWPRGVGE